MPNETLLRQALKVAEMGKQLGLALNMKRWKSAEGSCFAGWLAQSKTFMDLGLSVLTPAEAMCLHGQLLLRRKPVTLQGMEALEYLFELDGVQCAYLFGANPWQDGFDVATSWDEIIERVKHVLEGRV
jgi:hypothetical protein